MFQKKIKEFIGNKNIKTKIFRIQAYDSIMCEYFLLDLLILFLQERLELTLYIFFHQITLKKRWYNFKLFHDECLKMVDSH